MRLVSKLAAAAVLIAAVPSLAQYEDPRKAAEQMTAQEMAKALAEKARNDEIVRQQRAAEAAAKKPTPTPTPTPGSTPSGTPR
jgi:hypothetical protein